jgi:hypothetical protein
VLFRSAVGYIQANSMDIPIMAELRHSAVKAILPDIGKDNLDPIFQEHPGHAQTRAVGSPGNECYFPFNVLHNSHSFTLRFRIRQGYYASIGC